MKVGGIARLNLRTRGCSPPPASGFSTTSMAMLRVDRFRGVTNQTNTLSPLHSSTTVCINEAFEPRAWGVRLGIAGLSEMGPAFRRSEFVSPSPSRDHAVVLLLSDHKSQLIRAGAGVQVREEHKHNDDESHPDHSADAPQVNQARAPRRRTVASKQGVRPADFCDQRSRSGSIRFH